MKVLIIGHPKPGLGGLYTYEIELYKTLSDDNTKNSYEFCRFGKVHKHKSLDIENKTLWTVLNAEEILDKIKNFDYIIFTASHRLRKDYDEEIYKLYKKIMEMKRYTVVLHGISEFPTYSKTSQLFSTQIKEYAQMKNNITKIIYTKTELVDYYNFKQIPIILPIFINGTAVETKSFKLKNLNLYTTMSRLSQTKGIGFLLEIFRNRKERLEINGACYGMEGYKWVKKIKELGDSSIYLGGNPKGNYKYLPSDSKNILQDKIAVFDFSVYNNKKGMQYTVLDAMKNNCFIITLDTLNLHSSVQDLTIQVSLEDIKEKRYKKIWAEIHKNITSERYNSICKSYKELLDTTFSAKTFVYNLEKALGV